MGPDQPKTTTIWKDGTSLLRKKEDEECRDVEIARIDKGINRRRKRKERRGR